ncbi:MAG: sulfite exporter TauE/SafE family protein [Candidatus Peribacteraceae bacterium]|nr:sulfite exporter TauE/SafE family protein [Candidatus Peribacteraceae bacterium]
MLTEILRQPVVFYGAVLAASVLSTATGVGGMVLLLPFAALQFGAKEAVGIVTLFGLCQNINKIVVFRHAIRWRIGWRMIAWSVPAAIAGSLVLPLVPADLFRKLLAGTVLLYLANDLFRLVPSRGRPERFLPLLSVVYGFLSGLIGTGNIVKGPLFTGLGLLKEAYVGTYAFTALFMNIPKLASYVATGTLGIDALRQSVPFLLLSVAGTYAGSILLRRVRSDIFYYAVTASFVLSAVALLLE